MVITVKAQQKQKAMLILQNGNVGFVVENSCFRNRNAKIAVGKEDIDGIWGGGYIRLLYNN